MFKTISCDNGCENLNYEGMENSILTNKKEQRYTVHIHIHHLKEG